jgi:hypothetical protein
MGPPKDDQIRGGPGLLVDDVYATFCEDLPVSLQQPAQNLAASLGLSAPGVPWSRVFPHPFTLTVPGIVADASPPVDASVVRAAVVAHVMGLIQAVAMGREATGAVSATPEIRRVLSAVRMAKEQACGRLGGASFWAQARFDLAIQQVEQALSVERTCLGNAHSADWTTYERVATAKQAVMLPAPLSLARESHWRRDRREELRRMITAIALGLQLARDVTEWEDDHARGGAWALALARGIADADPDVEPWVGSVHSEVLESGILARLLRRAHESFQTGHELAIALGLGRVAQWTSTQGLALADLHRAEASFPGYAVRAAVLQAWAEEVLS